MNLASDARSASSISRSLVPCLVPFVEECLRNDALNCHGGILAVTGLKTSKINGSVEGHCDRFTVAIPYCGTHIKWEVVFDHTQPSYPPDIIFSDEHDRMFDPNIDNLKSLLEWTPTDITCLSRLIEELLLEYREHHRSLVSSHQRLGFELNTVLQSNQKYQCDVLSTANNNGEEPVKFYIPLDLDLTTLPAYLSKDNPGPDCAALMVTFHTPNATKVEPFLYLSPRLERMLGGSDTLRLPQWTNDSYLMDYVPNVHQLLQEKVNSLVQSYVCRKEYFAALLNIMGQAITEYDTEGFKKIAFLIEHHGFCFIATLELSDSYPQEIPLLCLSSVYYKFSGRPLKCSSKDYPYSPRWDADERARRLRQHFVDVAQQFKDLCKAEGEFL